MQPCHHKKEHKPFSHLTCISARQIFLIVGCCLGAILGVGNNGGKACLFFGTVVTTVTFEVLRVGKENLKCIWMVLQTLGCGKYRSSYNLVKATTRSNIGEHCATTSRLISMCNPLKK